VTDAKSTWKNCMISKEIPHNVIILKN